MSKHGRKPQELSVRFWAKVAKGDPDGCWLWLGSRTPINKSGYQYGQIKYGEHTIMAHRASYLLAHGEIDPDLEVCHSCDNSLCVNPRHLWQGTHLENMRDMMSKGRAVWGTPRAPVGELHGAHKLFDHQIIEIRKRCANGETTRSIAQDYGVSQVLIVKIKNRKTWKHIP